jgi:hypothetical protein
MAIIEAHSSGFFVLGNQGKIPIVSIRLLPAASRLVLRSSAKRFDDDVTHAQQRIIPERCSGHHMTDEGVRADGLHDAPELVTGHDDPYCFLSDDQQNCSRP